MFSNFLFSKPKNVGNAKCRPSTECQPITDRYIGQVSTNYRRNVGEVSANEKLYRPIHIWNDYRPCLNRVSTDYRPLCRPTVDRVSTEYRPSVDRLSTECRLSIDRLSTECRPLYRPISRSTLPRVNKIRPECSGSFKTSPARLQF